MRWLMIPHWMWYKSVLGHLFPNWITNILILCYPSKQALTLSISSVKLTIDIIVNVVIPSWRLFLSEISWNPWKIWTEPPSNNERATSCIFCFVLLFTVTNCRGGGLGLSRDNWEYLIDFVNMRVTVSYFCDFYRYQGLSKNPFIL